MDPEHDLYLRAPAGAAAPHLPLRADDRGRPHGLRQDDGRELVSRRAGEGRRRGIVRISVYSDHLAIFWKSVQEAFSHAGFDFLRTYPCPDDAAGGSLLTDDLCHALAASGPAIFSSTTFTS